MRAYGLALLIFCICNIAWTAPLTDNVLEVIKAHPHDAQIFTQGLALEGDTLYQSSGLRGKSRVLAGPIGSGKAERSFHFPQKYFAEGLCVVGNEVFVLTWQAGRLFVLDKHKLQLVRKLSYRGEGWGLAYDGTQLWLSDGSSSIRRYSADTMSALGRIQVHDANGPVRRINELEWVEGRLLANIWQSQRLIAIDPTTGAVTAQWDLHDIVPAKRQFGRDSVANGIAYDSASGHIWLTGKGWPTIYEVVLHGLAPQ